MKQKTMINDLTQGPLAKQIFLYAAPLALANLLQTLYNLVDLAVVGQVVGSEGLSAVSIAGQITFLLYALGIGLGSGCQILISQQVGSGDTQGVRRTIGTSLSFTVILAVIVTALGLIFKNPVLRLLNTPSEAWTDATEYMFWCCLGIPFTYGYGTLCAVLRGMGDSTRPMYIIAAAAVTNMILDLVLVWGLGMRAKGAGIATSIAQLASFLFALIYLYKHRETFGFDFKRESFRIHKRTLRVVISLAAPLAFMQIAINISMMFVNAWVNVYGVVASAVSGVGNKLYSLCNIITNSMQTAEATVTGQNIAARKPERVKKSLFVSTGICLAYWVILSALCLLFPQTVFGIFSSDEAVLAMAPDYMFILTWMYLSFALMAPVLGLISGVGNVKLNFVIALADGVVARIGLSLLLAIPMGMGLYGYWWGSALAGFVSVICGWIYFATGRWKNRQLLTAAI
ncbi:MAG: MATE family efflux transporter [Oscillospiraceae bacterium]|nr:MATE family efflux transporter [Oscillospiraceae bacterium]